MTRPEPPSEERIAGLYERHARAYRDDRVRMPFVERAWLERFMALLPRGGMVLDIGCGCGVPIAGHLIGCGFDVYGVDSSAGMIAACREQFPAQAWQVADMRAMELGRTFDGVLAWDSFFHLGHDHQRHMFARFARHAAPGAALMFTSGTEHGIAMGAYRGEPLYHASLSADAYRTLLREHGFSVRAHVAEDPDCGLRTVWLAQRDAD